MTKIVPDYKIAAGHNNAGGLTSIDALVDSDGMLFVMPMGLPNRTRGLPRPKPNGVTGRVGFNATRWVSSIMTVTQLALLYSTYELGEASGGLVTIRVALTSVTFANYNAALKMPDESELIYHPNIGAIAEQTATSGLIGPGYSEVTWTFTKLEAL